MLFDNTGRLENIIVCMGFTDFSIIEFNREFNDTFYVSLLLKLLYIYRYYVEIFNKT